MTRRMQKRNSIRTNTVSDQRCYSRFATRLVREAAQVIRTETKPRKIQLKSSFADMLTATDLKVEKLMRKRIVTTYPSHQIVGEEGADGGPLDLSRPTWFLDPVDGTTNYVSGLPHFGCNVGFWDGQRILCGATADVLRRRVYWAEAGRGAWLGRQRIKVSSATTLSDSVVATGFPYSRAVNPDNNLAEFSEIVPMVRDVRRLGCAGLDLSWVASGLLDGYWEQGNGPWDWIVGALLVREAGGSATTYDGSDWVPGDRTFVATNGRIRPKLLDAISTARATHASSLHATS